MSGTANYYILKDDHLGWSKLYRSDSDALPPGEILWKGNSLLAGYDAMKTINTQNREIVRYHLCTSISAAGREIFRIYKDLPEKPWALIKTHATYPAAKAQLNDMRVARDVREKEELEKKLSILRRVHYEGKKVPKLTATEWKYLEWLKETDRLTPEQKETLEWFKETAQASTITA